jgi:uncharacterized membrane protein YoaK (UPF0700 family)
VPDTTPLSPPAPDPPGPLTVHERWELGGLFLLTIVTGMVDATSFLGLGLVFTANMTGNVLLLGFSVTSSHATHLAGLSLSLTATALGAFVAGALSGAWVAGGRGAVARPGAGFAVEWLTLAGAVLVLGLAGPGGTGAHYAAVALLGASMGVQNAVVRRMGVPDVNTTVLTTTLGGLAADAVEVGGRSVRLGRRVATVTLIFAGAAAGAGLLQVGVVWSALGALVVMTVAALVLVRSLALRAVV